MVDYITISNYENTIILDRDEADYLIDDNGLDWGEISSKFSTLNNLDNIGTELNAIETSDPREIKMVGWVVGTESQMAAKKSVLAQTISPQREIYISVYSKRNPSKVYTLTAYAASAPKFGNTVQTNNEVMCQFELRFSAIYQYFELAKEYTITETGSQIQNLGSIPVGVDLRLTMNTSVTDPYIIFRRGTREYAFGTFGTFDSGTIIHVNTECGSRVVTVGGTKDYSIVNLNMGEWIQVPVSYSEQVYTSVSIPSGVTAVVKFKEAYSYMEDL